MFCLKYLSFLVTILLLDLNIVKSQENFLKNKTIETTTFKNQVDEIDNDFIDNLNETDINFENKNSETNITISLEKIANTQRFNLNNENNINLNKLKEFNLKNNNENVFEDFNNDTSNINKIENIEVNNKDDKKNLLLECSFFQTYENNKIVIEFKNITNSKLFNSDECINTNSHRITLNENELKVEENYNDLNNTFTYKLPNFIFKEGTLKVKLQRTTLNNLKTYMKWISINNDLEIENFKTENKGLIISFFQNENLIKIFSIKEISFTEEEKEISFINLPENQVYSISISYSEKINDVSDKFYENKTNQTFFIKNIYQILKTNSLKQNDKIKKSYTVLLFTISSLAFLALILILLYYRRNSFKSLLNNQFKKMPKHQNSKYLRRNNNQTDFNLNNTFSDLTFEQRFLNNTVQLNNQTNNGFMFRNDRHKNASNKSSISRVLENSVATIKKRTSIKPISQTIDELNLKTMGSGLNFCKPIALVDFLPFISELTKTNYQKLNKEFMQLNILNNTFKPILKSNKIGRSSKNIDKNNEGGIFPYDYSRVILEKNNNLTSDYINASYIPGFNSKKEYIACQTPSKNTFNSFWAMCWQENIKNIVMICENLKNSTTDKYWPDDCKNEEENILRIENFTIKLINKKETKNFSIKIFELKMDQETKILKHFQINDWNSFDNLNDVKLILDFVEQFRDQTGLNYLMNDDYNESPIIVHCNNGVYKTAVFIAVDRIYVQLKKGKNNMIDIFGTVIEMRKYRPMMIQNEQQYRFVYDCIAELIRKLHPYLVKQMEFDSTLDEINLTEVNDFDNNNNLNSSYQNKVSLADLMKTSNLINQQKINGIVNETFVEEKISEL